MKPLTQAELFKNRDRPHPGNMFFWGKRTQIFILESRHLQPRKTAGDHGSRRSHTECEEDGP